MTSDDTSMNHTPRHPFEIAFWCIPAIFAGFMLLQGHAIRFKDYFTPWHHDDFMALSEFAPYAFFTTRPVSMGVMAFLGRLGDATYYFAYTGLILAILALTYVLAVKALRLRASLLLHMALCFAGAVVWFSQSSSVQSLQYIGLTTNAVSYLFGFCAALVLVDLGNRGVSIARRPLWLALFTVLAVLAAFSKEDMAPFLLCAAAFSAVTLHQFTRDLRSAVAHFLVSACVIVLIFALSIAHARTVGSPFIGGTGAYSLANFAQNILGNFKFYTTITASTTVFMIAYVGLVAVLVGVSLREVRFRPVALAACFFLVGSFALMTPYLILPRNFDYYSMNFFPLLAFSAPVVLLVTLETVGAPRRLAVAVVVALAAAIGLGDGSVRGHNLAWMTTTRTASRIQIEEVVRAADFGLKQCPQVIVHGAASLGPFLATSAAYLNRQIRGDTRWQIEPVAGSMVATWAGSRSFDKDRWSYGPAQEQSVPANCRLSLDPKTHRLVPQDRGALAVNTPQPSNNSGRAWPQD